VEEGKVLGDADAVFGGDFDLSIFDKFSVISVEELKTRRDEFIIIQYTSASQIETDVELLLTFQVKIKNLGMWYVEHDTSFEEGNVYGEISFSPAMMDGCRLYDSSAKTEFLMSTFVTKDMNLVLSHLVTVSGVVKDKSFIENGTKLGNMGSLKKYFDDTDYVIVDEKDNNTVYGEKTIVLRDLNLIVRKSTKIVIELDPVDESEVNETEVISVISQLTGIDEDKIVVKVDTDDKGNVVSIIVYVNEDTNAEVVVEAVNKINTDSDECDSGVLCRKKRAYVVVKDKSILEMSCRNSIHIVSIVISIVLFMVF